MKTLLLVNWLLLIPFCAQGQGILFFSNPGAPTHIGSVDGPLAGPGIWAQLLAGLTTDSLTPVGAPAEHIRNGGVLGGQITVPGIDGGTTVHVQMLAWNGTQWGTSLNGVPPDQIGSTDIIPVRLSYSFEPVPGLFFGQSAIVPIPEPSVWSLAMLGTGAVLVRRFIRCHRRPR